jgi:uncharacterized surface protein with fasciclin (FAS1) repeats
MISIKNKFKTGSFIIATSVMIFSACNKAPEQILGPAPVVPTGLSLAETLAATPTDSLYYRMIVRGGQLATISNKANSYTMFVPDNVAMRQFINAASGGAIPVAAPDAVHSNFISTVLPASSAGLIVGYNICPQSLLASSIPATFPNLQYPSILNPAPTVSAFLRLTTFPSTRNGAWLNNIPITATNVLAANGVIHHTAAVTTPPSRYLWNRIDTDPGLTYLKAAINRADSGTAAPGFLQGVLLNIGANLTVFAPTDAAFQATLTGAIYQGLLGLGFPAGAATLAMASAMASTPAVFSNPALYGVLTAQTVKGIVVYHVLGSRAFTNNFPTTTTSYPTLLNGAIAAHPGVALTAVFGAPFVSSATVKGLGNATASNLIINAAPLIPDPSGTSDQHYLNGVLHKINQVLLPQ